MADERPSQNRSAVEGCSCGHKPMFCHRLNAQRYCGTLDPALLFWVAQEISNAADAIGPAPDLAERALRALADKVQEGQIEPWGGL